MISLKDLKDAKAILTCKAYPSHITCSKPLSTAYHKSKQVSTNIVSPSNNHLKPYVIISKNIHNNAPSQRMEILIKQTRARFPSTRQENTEERGKKIPPQKTLSIGEKKRSQSWLRRQFSRQMSWDYDFSGSDYTAAVAAAAYAIQSVEESKTKDQKEKTFVPDKSLNKRKSEMETPPEQRKSALKSSDETRRKSFKDPDVKMPERIAGSAPPIKKKLSFADINETINRVPEEPKVEKARIISASVQKDDATKPGNFKADAWEREEMASVKARYEKLRGRIENWETKKKTKAKRKIERIEAELDKRRMRAAQSHRIEIKRIEGIAGGAKAQAEKNQRNEELKVIEKANKIRSTGKLPPTCLCF